MMETQQLDEIREMFKNEDGSCKLSRSDVLRIVRKLENQEENISDEACRYCGHVGDVETIIEIRKKCNQCMEEWMIR